MKAPHVLVDALVLERSMGGALRYAIETLPRCAQLLNERGGRLSILLAGSECEQDWIRPLIDRTDLHVFFVGKPMHFVLGRALREGRAVRNWIEQSARQGQPVHVVQTQSLPIPRLHFEGRHIHLCHGLRRQHTGPNLLRGFAKALLARGVRDLSSMLTVSQSLTQELRQQFPDLNLQSAPPGCDHWQVKPRQPNAQPFILCPGPIDPHKNHKLLLDAWQHNPDLPPLRIHAQPGPDLRNLRDRAQQLNLQARISWHPPLTANTWPEALATCAAVVLPSRLESFGMVALETLHAGTPLALSDLPSHREIAGPLHDQVAFFPTHNPTETALAIHRAAALDNPQAREKRQQRANQFTWQNTAQSTVTHWCADNSKTQPHNPRR